MGAPPPDADDELGDAAAAPSVEAALAGYARGIRSIARPMRAWYVASRTDELGSGPIRRTIFGLPIVLFRERNGAPAALLDRCPHRNVPLSAGAVVEGQLQCAYHGWRFDGSGGCRLVPSRLVDETVRSHDATAFPTTESDGFVWVYPTSGETPHTSPYRFRLLDDARYTVVRHTVDAPATLHATIENALDVPHTQFLHRGLFRAESRGIRVTAKVRRYDDRVEAEYVGEPRPVGLVARLISPSGGLVTHFDRFLLPSIAEVEYRIGEENHLLVAVAMTPLADFETRLHAVVAVRARIPGRALAPIVKPLALRIFAQDASMLALQTQTIRAFGGERYASTEIDVLGRHVLRLLRTAERSDAPRTGALLSEEETTLVI